MAAFTFPKKYVRPVLACAALALAALGSYFRVLELYELQTYDWRCQIRGPRPVSKDIVLIDIWNDSLEVLGAWPFDREYHANLIQVLQLYGAKAVIFDIIFPDPREHDDLVAETAKNAKNVYFAFSFAAPSIKNGIHYSGALGSDLLPPYRNSAKGVGFVNTQPDIDGERRRVMPVMYFQDKPYYQLSFRAAADILGNGIEGVKHEPRRYLEITPGVRAPLDDQGCFIINYAGTWEKAFQHYSYLDILYSAQQIAEGEAPRVPLEQLKGKICIIGLTSQGSMDTSPVPIQSVYPMVGSYANIINGLLLKDFIWRAPRWLNLLALLLFGALIAWISTRHKPIRALWFTLAVMAFFLVLAVALFSVFGVWIDIFLPTAFFLVLYASMTLSRVLSEMRKRELIENELKIASQIQKSFLPAVMPEVKGLTVAVFFQPAKAVVGELYEFVKQAADDQLGVMAVDVSGKGTPAALFMAKTVSEFKFSARDSVDPAKALEQVNNAISTENTGGLFVTMAYAIFNIGKKSVTMSNGGHLPVVVVGADGKSDLLTPGDGMPIGVMEGIPFGILERPLAPGDIFAFYSDGVSEARNRKKDEYGIERLQSELVKHRADSAEKALAKTVLDLIAFIGKADQHDDITLIIVKIDDAA